MVVSPGRAGTVLVFALLGSLILGIIGLPFLSRSSRSAQTGNWGEEHLVLRQIAESAAEELSLAIQVRGNTPDDPLFTQLRTLEEKPKGDIELQGLRADATQGLLARKGQELGGTVGLLTRAYVADLDDISPDPSERAGIVTIEATASLSSRHRSPVSERVQVEREMRVARVTPPWPLDRMGVFLRTTGWGDLHWLHRRPGFANASAEPVTFKDLLDHPWPTGIRRLKWRIRKPAMRAMDALLPDSIAERAQLVVPDIKALGTLLADAEARGGLNGVIHVNAPECIALSFTSFRGRCLLSFAGPVEVKDIRVEDPRRDSLTIVTPQQIVVSGKNVEANLVHSGELKDGMVFKVRSLVKGLIVAYRFPKRKGISPEEHGSCQVQHPAPPAERRRIWIPPGPEDIRNYVLALSPEPLYVAHLRDGKEDQGW